MYLTNIMVNLALFIVSLSRKKYGVQFIIVCTYTYLDSKFGIKFIVTVNIVVLTVGLGSPFPGLSFCYSARLSTTHVFVTQNTMFC